MTSEQGRILTGLIRIAPRRGDHRVALRVAVSLGVPLLLLWMTGRLELSVFASFGAFTSLYGRYDHYVDRIRMQAAAGASLVVAMLVGTLLSFVDAPLILRVASVAVLATVFALLAYGWHWHPPGALFAVFAAGASASLPATSVSFVHVLVAGGGAAVFSLAITVGIVAVRRLAWRRSGRRLNPPSRRTRRPFDRAALGMALTVLSGSFISGVVGLLLVGDHWYWAMVAAVAALAGTQLNARIIRGIQRLVGTLAGVLVAAGFLALNLDPLVTVLLAVVLQACAELFVNRNYGLAMLFVTPLALLMVELAVPADPGTLLLDRAIDTVIGVIVGTAVAVVSAALRGRAARGSSTPA